MRDSPSAPPTICFVCQRGPLETQALLLAASLRLHFPPATRLLAAHPRLHGELHRDTLNGLEQLGVERAVIENPLRADYLIGHKLAALALLQDSPLGVFLDSDILAMAAPASWPQTLAAVPATRQHCGLTEWQYLYQTFGLPPPAEPLATLSAGEFGMPYFNSGMIAAPGELAGSLASCWIETARRIDADRSVGRHIKSPWLDQVSLPVAAARLGRVIAPLDPSWNYPSWIWRIGDRRPPVFFHYQKLARLHRERVTLEAARTAAAAVPHLLLELEHPANPVRDWFRRLAVRSP